MRKHRTLTCETGGLRHVVDDWTTWCATALCGAQSVFVQIYDWTNFATCLWCAAGKRRP